MSIPEQPRLEEGNTWPYIYTRDGLYRYLPLDKCYIRIDEREDYYYNRDKNGKFVRKI